MDVYSEKLSIKRHDRNAYTLPHAYIHTHGHSSITLSETLHLRQRRDSDLSPVQYIVKTRLTHPLSFLPAALAYPRSCPTLPRYTIPKHTHTHFHSLPDPQSKETESVAICAHSNVIFRAEKSLHLVSRSEVHQYNMQATIRFQNRQSRLEVVGQMSPHRLIDVQWVVLTRPVRPGFAAVVLSTLN